MSEQRPLVSIDFGNSNTKVGLRADWGEESRLVRDASLQRFDPDQLDICVPTVAAVSADGQWHYGIQVPRLGHAEHVYRNWKPRFFSDERGDVPQPVVKHETNRLPDPIWEGLRATGNLQETDRPRIEAMILGEEAASELVEENDGEIAVRYKEVAVGFFHWLRTFLTPIARSLNIEDLSRVPTRITLPAFTDQSAAGAAAMLTEVLTEAGWLVDTKNAALHEPIANAIGVFTEGRNVVWRPDELNWGNELHPNYQKMFYESKILDQLRKRQASRFNRRMHWVMLVDVGGYTTDFAMMGFDLEDLNEPLQGTYQGRRRLARHSVALGLTDLDRAVMDSLDDSQREALNKLVQSPDHRRMEVFRRDVYQRHGGFRFASGVQIGGRNRRDELDQVLTEFGQRVRQATAEFLELENTQRVDELILTGGGCAVPAVRDAVVDLLSGEPYHVKHAYVPAIAEEASSLPEGMTRLPPHMVRGATALGGSSVFFDFAEDGNGSGF